MRIVGKRKQRTLGKTASGANLKAAACFNEGLYGLPTGGTTFIPRGVYRFATHEEANAHWQECVAKGMAAHARR